MYSSCMLLATFFGSDSGLLMSATSIAFEKKISDFISRFCFFLFLKGAKTENEQFLWEEKQTATLSHNKIYSKK